MGLSENGGTIFLILIGAVGILRIDCFFGVINELLFEYNALVINLSSCIILYLPFIKHRVMFFFVLFNFMFFDCIIMFFTSILTSNIVIISFGLTNVFI